MRTEIGSEFWNVPTSNKENSLFPESTQWFLSGRSALQAVIRNLKEARSVSLPSWCCDSMIKPFVDAGMKVQFYPVYWQEGLIQEIKSDSDVLFLMDYFGYTFESLDLGDYKGTIIRDVTHSIFLSAYTDADYYFGSLRKWCGIWTGGYAWTKDGHALQMDYNDDLGYIHLREKAMQLKSSFIHGYVDHKGHRVRDKGYLKLFNQAEEALEHVKIAPADFRDIELAKKLDVDLIRNRRRANTEVLRMAFPEWLIFPELSASDTPMFVPVLVPDGKRDELRRYLIKNEIYCPVHWPVSVYHRLNDKEQFIYDNELSLVCDQRYIEDDMNRMVETIKAFWKEV